MAFITAFCFCWDFNLHIFSDKKNSIWSIWSHILRNC